MPATVPNSNRDLIPSRSFFPHAGPLRQQSNNDPPFVHAPYDNTSSNLLTPPAYNLTAWPQSHFSGFQPVPQLPPPPTVAHQVWILDCNSCGTFLTNRGMKAVLLLHPNVSLYSTDALPINCSALDASRPAILRSRSDSRTCECLTHTLCCHGCGSAIGYMIVIPCTRCTGSMTATNRTTNGHRFIFHSSEVLGTERHYIPNEPGVIPYDPPQGSPIPGVHLLTPAQSLELGLPHDGSHEDTSSHMTILDEFYISRGSRELPRSHAVELGWVESHSSTPTEVKESWQPRKLKAGDLVFWHHLSRHGEIPGVADDSRARGQRLALRESPGVSWVFDR